MSDLFDEFAKTLAKPMGRRRALGLVAGAIGGAVVGAVRPGRAGAQAPCTAPGAVLCGDTPNGPFCCDSNIGETCCSVPGSAPNFTCCPPCTRCDPSTGQCVPTGLVPCGTTA